jgi:hypothetical protein
MVGTGTVRDEYVALFKTVQFPGPVQVDIRGMLLKRFGDLEHEYRQVVALTFAIECPNTPGYFDIGLLPHPPIFAELNPHLAPILRASLE